MKRRRDRERDEATAREQAERRREELLSDLRGRLGSSLPPEPEPEPEPPERSEEPEPAEGPESSEGQEEPGSEEKVMDDHG